VWTGSLFEGQRVEVLGRDGVAKMVDEHGV
jgi:hypothetical protein